MIETIGVKELERIIGPLSCTEPSIPWKSEELEKFAATHILIFTPSHDDDRAPITLLSLRARYGLDPAVSEPCFYNQDWYLKEDFAAQALDGQWHLIRKDVRDDTRARLPETIESSLVHERFPTAGTAAFTFFMWYLLKGEVLWKHDFLWCSDRDHNNDRIYVGQYEDPTGTNKNGFNIHRHLALRPAYSAAPEIIAG